MPNLLQDFYNFGCLVFYFLKTARSLVETACYGLFWGINIMLPVVKGLFSLIPGLLSVMTFIISSTISIFHLAFTIVFIVSAPIISTCGYLLQWLLPTSVVQDFYSVFNTLTAWCSYFTIYVISIILMITGSLIIATEENIEGRNKFRPKTTVPLICLVSGLVLHYDKIQSNDWVAPVAFFTGALWYFVSLVYDDIASRERSQAERSNIRGSGGGSQSRSMSPLSISDGHLHPRLRERTPLKLRKSGGNDDKCCVIRPASPDSAVGEGTDGYPRKPEVMSVRMECSCPICFIEFEPDEVVRALSCSHSFHQECIGKWFTKSNRCPICWKPQTKYGQLVHALFE